MLTGTMYRGTGYIIYPPLFYKNKLKYMYNKYMYKTYLL
jgi:hypothetical protein